MANLFEDLAVGVGVGLALNLKGAVPGPLSLDVLAVLLVGRVELGELVALVVGSNIEDREELLAADEEGTLDDGVVVDTIDGRAAEEVLARSLKTGVEAANEVVGHEGEGELIVVLVLDLPERVLLKGDVLPEPLEGLGGILVGVLALPLVKRDGGLAEGLARVLGLRSLLGSIILLLGSGLGGSLGSLSGLGLLGGSLGGGVGESGGIEKLKLGPDSVENGLGSDRGEPAAHGRVLLAPCLVEEELEAARDETGREEVGEGDALANKVGVVEEVLLNNRDGGESLLGGLLDGLLVVRLLANEGTEPATNGGKDLHVEEGQPLKDRGIAT